MPADGIRKVLLAVSKDPDLQKEMLEIVNKRKLAKWLAEQGQRQGISFTQGEAAEFVAENTGLLFAVNPDGGGGFPPCPQNNPDSAILTTTNPFSAACGPHESFAYLIRAFSPRFQLALDSIARNQQQRDALAGAINAGNFRAELESALSANGVPSSELTRALDAIAGFTRAMKEIEASLGGGTGPVTP